MPQNIQPSKANQSNLLVLFEMLFDDFYYSIIFQGFRFLWTKEFK